MPYFGCHLSVAGGFRKMGEDALSIGATTFAYFTRNPRGGAVKTPAAEDVAALRKIISENRFGPIVAHGPYTLNPCSSDAKVRDFALMAMKDDLARMDEILDAMAALRPLSRETFAAQPQRREFLRRCLDEMLSLARPLTGAETDAILNEVKEKTE